MMRTQATAMATGNSSISISGPSTLHRVPAAVDRLLELGFVQFEETEVVVAADVDERAEGEREEHLQGEVLHQSLVEPLLEDARAEVLHLAQELPPAQSHAVGGVVELLHETELHR